ncbi:MAG TPA: flagellar motor protein MotB [Stellaceae bacterium]|nr:flagellar motor protein MotB [Stellaceae bacterium]
MAKPANGTIVIKKIKKGGHAGHHGGAWKVAYADFVTAMMAFFLLLWLLNVTTDVQKRGIADYFDPTISLRSDSSGSGKILGGESLGKPGQLTDTAAAAVTMPIPAERQPNDGDNGEDSGNPSQLDEQKDTDAADKSGVAENTEPGSAPGKLDPSRLDQGKPEQTKLAKSEARQAEKALAAKEEQQFAAAEFSLRQAIQDIPDLKQLAQNLIIDRTPEGLRIQLVDQDKYSMFPLGSSEMVDSAKKLMALVARVVQKLPNKISVTGHTDSTPFARAGNYGNWELSSDRANASRRALIAAGVPADRITKVVGAADRDPLLPDDPASPRNRRISIVLLREAKPPVGTLAQR